MVRAADGSPEIGAWVVVRPDDTVVIRIARSEMGQGSLTGLAQLVAEELECDWSKVSTEYPTPGQSVARKRVWGDFSTGGSRGIRSSQDYYPESELSDTAAFETALTDLFLGPDEGLGSVVVCVDVGIDVFLKLLEAREGGAAERLPLQDGKPYFDLIEP
ncbi:hypothetical protein ACVIWV_005112 [Bradyrhizobium diazoefficiens]